MAKSPTSLYTLGRRGLAWIKLQKELATLDIAAALSPPNTVTENETPCSATTPSPCATATNSLSSAKL